MEQFVWKEGLNTGIQELDDQHRHFFDIINQLRLAVGSDSKRSILVDTFSKLIEYMQVHFSTEEKILERCHYPELEQHMELHEIFVDKVTGLFSDYLQDKADILQVTLDFSQNWLVNHIMNEDMKFKVYLAQCTSR